jgi:hypothetical protein
MEKDLKVKIDVDSASAKEKVEVFSNLLTNVKDGFTAAKDVAAMFGLENKKIEGIINSVTIAQDNLAKAQKVAGEIQKGYAAAVNAVANAKKAFTLVMQLASTGLKAFRLALAGTGIGLIVVAIGLLVANFNKIKEVVGRVINSFPPLKAVVDQVKLAFEKVSQGIGFFTSLFNQIKTTLINFVLNLKPVQNILGFVREKFDGVITVGKNVIDNFNRIANAVLGLIKDFPFLTTIVEGVKNVFFSIVETGKEFLEWLGFTPIKVEESNKAVAKSNKKAVEEAKGAANEQAKIEQGKTDAKANEDKKQVESEEQKAKRLEEERIKRLKQDQDYEKLRLANMEEGRKKELAGEELKYAEEKERYKGNTKALEELKKLHEKRVSEINKEWDTKEQKEREDRHKAVLEANDRWVKRNEESKRKSLENEFKLLEKSLKDKEITEEEALIRKQSLTQDFYEQQKADLQTHYDELLATELEKKANNQLSIEEYEAIEKALQAQKVEDEAALKIQQQAAEKELDTAIDEEKNARLIAQIEREKAITKAKWEFAEKAAKDGLDVIDTVNKNLIKNAKTQNDIEKAITLVKIGIDSAKAISSAISNANAPTPDNVATGGIAGIAKFAAISAQIASAVAQAHKVLSSGGNIGGGGGAPSTPSISAPQIIAPQIGTTQIIARQHSPEPLKVFVTEADIRSAQQKVKVIEDQSVVV